MGSARPLQIGELSLMSAQSCAASIGGFTRSLSEPAATCCASLPRSAPAMSELVAGAGSYLIYPGREVVAVEAKP